MAGFDMQAFWARLVPPRLTKAVSDGLTQAGWSVRQPTQAEMRHPLQLYADRDNVRTGVVLSEPSRQAKVTELKDAVHCCMTLKIVPVLVYAGSLDPAARNVAVAANIPVVALDRLDTYQAAVDAITPRVHGTVDAIDAKGVVSGWAKFTVGTKQAEIAICVGEQTLGRGMADRHRRDLEQFGDGRFGFSIAIPPITDMDRFLVDLRVRAYRESLYIALVPVWSDAVIRR